MSLTNPFTYGSALNIPDRTYRFPLSTPASANATPVVPASLTYNVSAAQISSVLSSLTYVAGYVSTTSNNFGMTASQQVSLANVTALFNSLTAGLVTFTVAQLQDIVVVSQMIRSWNGVNINPISTSQIVTDEGTCLSFTVTAAGTSYVSGTYTNISLTGGSGTGAAATIVVSGGGITSVTLVRGGFGYKSTDVLSCLNTNLSSPAGTGFTCSIASFNPVAITTVTDPAFPYGATTIICNDGYFLTEQYGTGNFWVSVNQDGTAWNGITTATIESRSDTLIAIDQMSGGQVVLFGSRSMEYWYDATTTPMPYARVTGQQQDYGLAAKWSRASISNSIAFLGQNFQGQVQIMLLNGYVPESISTPDINNIINSFSTVNDAVAYSFIFEGHEIYRITFPSANRTFDYDTLTEIWSEAQSGMNVYNRHLTSLGISYNYCAYASDCVNGNIYLLDTNNYTDNGSFIRREVDSAHVNLSNNRFQLSSIYLNMDVGNGSQNATIGDNNAPMISMQWSKDYGKTYSDPRLVSMGTTGNYLTRVEWRRLGVSRDFVFKFVQTSAVPFVISFAAGSVVPGTFKQ